MPKCAQTCHFMLLSALHTFASETKRIEIMEQAKTTYNTLPEQIDFLIQEILEIKNILADKIEKPEEIPKWLNKEQALEYIQRQGYMISSSKFYKMSAQDTIPCHRSGNRLYFLIKELDEWLEKQIDNKKSKNIDFHSVQEIIKSAQNKY